jgi:succinyl-diaminopimelate desuccinylase
MSQTPVRTYIQNHREDLVGLTLDLLSVETSNPPGETVEIVTLIEQYLGSLSVDFEQFVVDPAKPNLVVTVPGEVDATLLFTGHLDTVPFDTDAWSYDPLGERSEDRLYGRGATDMKGPLAAMLYTIEAYAETDTIPPINLLYAFVSDEEVGGDAGLPALLKGNQLDAEACVIGEPTCEENRHSVTVADRGSIWLTLEASGEAAHGSRPILGENAIDRLYGAIETLRDRFGNRTLDIDPTMQPILDESVEYYGPMMGEDEARALFTSPSINLGTFEGGEAINTVPQTARAEVDIRLTAGVETSEMLADIRSCVADCDGITITDVSWSVGTAEPIDSPLVEAVVTTAEELTGDRVFRRSATGGGDAKSLRNAGIPTVEFAFGTDTVHAVDEYITTQALIDNSVLYGSLPQKLASSHQ